MATVTTSIGTNSSIDTETPSSGSGSNPYTVTFTNDPTGVSVGDSMEISNGMGTTYNYLVTEISGSDYTLKWITGGGFATNPYGITDPYYNQADGTFKRTYSTIGAWESDLDDTSYYSSSDDAVGEAYNDSVFDEYIVIDSGGTVGLSSVTLTAPSSERHDGKAGTGTRIEYTGNEGSSFRIRRSQCTVEWLELDLTSTGSSVSAGLNFGTNSTQEVYARNNIIHGLTTQSTHIHGVYIWGTGDSSNTRYLMNNLIYNMDNSSSSKSASGVTVSSGNWGVYLYNNTVYYVKSTAVGDDAFCFSIHDTDTFIKNNIAARPSAWHSSYQKCFAESGFSGSTHDYNLSTDSTATGTNSLTGEDYEDLFVSVTGGTEDLHLEEGAAAIDAGVDLGTSPTGVNIDIDGFDRDTVASWDIGADEYVSSATVVTPSAAAFVADAVSPTVASGLSLTPSVAAFVADAVSPTLSSGLSLTPAVASFVADAVSPTVASGLSLTPSAAAFVAAVVSPTLSSGLSLTPAVASFVADAVSPTVSISGGGIDVTPSAASVVAAAQSPTASIALSLTPAAATLVADAQTPTITSALSLTPAAASVVATGISPTASSGLTLTPAVAPSAASAVSPTVTSDISLTPAVARFVAAAIDPTVVVSGSSIVTPAAAVVVCRASVRSVDPTGILYIDTPRIKAPSIASPRIKSPDISGHIER